MKLNINIPTRGRPEKLDACLRSIDYCEEMKIYIHCHDRAADLPDTILEYEGTMKHDYCIFEDKNLLTIASHNLVCKNEGHFLGLSDDIVFHRGAIRRAVWMLESDLEGDGIVDFTVANMKAPDGCYMLLGNSFINKFADRIPYCPEYKFMFASAELRDFAKSIDQFQKCEYAQLDHYHPSVTGKPDETHKRIRSGGIIHDDEKIYNERRRSGKLWSHST